MNIPVFGISPETPAIERPAAYALLRTVDGVALVRTEGGKLFLPGGGILDEESPEDAVVRELSEECCVDAACVGRLSEAVQFFTAASTGLRYRSHMFFIECRVLEINDGQGDHETQWFIEAPKRSDFAHEAHCWAFCEYLASIDE